MESWWSNSEKLWTPPAVAPHTKGIQGPSTAPWRQSYLCTPENWKTGSQALSLRRQQAKEIFISTWKKANKRFLSRTISSLKVSYRCRILSPKEYNNKIWIPSPRKQKFRWRTPLSLPHFQAWRSRFDSCPPLPRCHPLPVPSYDICSAWSSGRTVSPRPLWGLMSHSHQMIRGVFFSRKCNSSC